MVRESWDYETSSYSYGKNIKTITWTFVGFSGVMVFAALIVFWKVKRTWSVSGTVAVAIGCLVVLWVDWVLADLMGDYLGVKSKVEWLAGAYVAFSAMPLLAA